MKWEKRVLDMNCAPNENGDIRMAQAFHQKMVAAVVVTYNRKDLLVECIEQLLAQTARDEMDVIVIDNNSSDGTEAALAPYIEKDALVYHNTGENLGGAGGFQLGMRIAAEAQYEYIWVMDDDTIPHPDALERLLEAASEIDSDWGFLSSKVLWKDGSVCEMNRQRETLTKNIPDSAQDLCPVVMASFVSLFVPVSVIKEVGLPIKEFFIWTDDWEFTRRISLQHKCYLVSSSIVVHKCMSNHGANIAVDSADRLGRYNYLYRNDVYLYRREGMKGFLYEAARLAGHAIRVVLRSKDNKGARLKMIAKGTIDGLSFNPVIEFPADNDA